MKFKVGDKVRIINMVGEPHYNNKEGVIECIDSLGQLHGTWGWLAVQPERDKIEIITKIKTLEDKIQEFQLSEVDIRRDIFNAIDGAKDINLGLECGDYVDIKEVKYRDVYLRDGSILNISTKELIDLYYIIKGEQK